ncbi:hypothetical protein EG68_06834 [Paragonimus skrjabini miyazakii]|uniref:Uncharacterized protein n=1 Tax=Paragonimus skrjabini miyazakii TaxID=59628 RepID=A0A8S9YTA1_9TREM|nr:hypothetical protein EG68_06834 [Paragonimus skrjabini miyazakii]
MIQITLINSALRISIEGRGKVLFEEDNVDVTLSVIFSCFEYYVAQSQSNTTQLKMISGKYTPPDIIILYSRMITSSGDYRIIGSTFGEHYRFLNPQNLFSHHFVCLILSCKVHCIQRFCNITNPTVKVACNCFWLFPF